MARYDTMIRRSYKVVGVSGEERQCICPAHKDRSGHLYINAVSGLFLCHVCGHKGALGAKKDVPADIDDLHAKLEELRKGKQGERFHAEGWLRQFDFPHEYWSRRGLSDDIVQMFRLGYDPFTDRMTLPLRDVHGNLIGVTYRRLDGFKPKYVHPKGFPTGRHLYGAWLLGNQTTIAITEGQIDAIRCWSERIPAVATMGSKITRDQIAVLQKLGIRKVVVLYDNDNAGRKGTLSVWESMKGSGIQVTAGWYRPYWFGVKDPDNLTGPRLRKLYHSATDLSTWSEHALISQQAASVTTVYPRVVPGT